MTRKSLVLCVLGFVQLLGCFEALADNCKFDAQKLTVQIRWMIRQDMREVLDIESKAFENPWLEEDFIRSLRHRNVTGMVAEYDDKVLAHMIYERHKTRLHLLNFAVDPDYHRQGIGSQMIAKLTARLSNQRRTRILSEVRETNIPAQLFFKNRGFRAVSILKDFYDDSPEDAYLFQYRVAPPVPKPIVPDGTRPPKLEAFSPEEMNKLINKLLGRE